MSDRTVAVARFLSDRSRPNRDAVIEAHGYLCRRGARKFRRPESDFDDLVQVAAVGLIKATDSYLAERSTPFEAYAWMLIVGELMHYVRDHERPIRIPRKLRALERRYAVAWEALAAELQTEPNPLDLAHRLGVDLPTIEAVRAMRRFHQYDGEDAGRVARPCDAFPNPATISLEERLTVLLAIEELSERERTVVIGTFSNGLSQHEIALMLGLSQSQVSKILSRALSKLHDRVA